jgi:hypothetical protein
MTDLSYRQWGRPTTNKPETILTTAKIWSRVPEGLNAKTGWLTDRQLQCNSDVLWLQATFIRLETF